jgi:hypothetical protein
MTVKTEANTAESVWTIDLFIATLPTRVRASRDAFDGSLRALIRVTKSDRHLTERASLLMAKDRTPAQLHSSIPSFPPSRRPLAPSIDFANLIQMFTRSFQQPTGRGVDYRGNSARSGIERILSGHDKLLETLALLPNRENLSSGRRRTRPSR